MANPSLKLVGVVFGVLVALTGFARADGYIGVYLGYETHEFTATSVNGPTATFDLGYDLDLAAGVQVGLSLRYTPTTVVERTTVSGPLSETMISLGWRNERRSGPFFSIGSVQGSSPNNNQKLRVEGKSFGFGYVHQVDPQIEYTFEISVIDLEDGEVGLRTHAERLRLGSRYRF
jgi:hypothetical protein